MMVEVYITIFDLNMSFWPTTIKSISVCCVGEIKVIHYLFNANNDVKITFQMIMICLMVIQVLSQI